MLDNNLQFAREEQELTQEELGFIFGVDRSTISGWETGKDIIPIRKLVKFCNLYGYSLNYIMGFTRENFIYPKIESIDATEIGKNLRNVRTTLGITQQQIADACSIRQSTYSQYESGQSLINTMTLYTLCKKYDIVPDLIIRVEKSTFVKM